MAYKQRTPFQTKGARTPYKFLGGLGKKIIGGANKLFGGAAQRAVGIQPGAGSGAPAGAVRDIVGGMGMNRIPGLAGRGLTGFGSPGMGAAQALGSPMVKKIGFPPYKKGNFSSPFKFEAGLVSGARDAATGFGTAKYGITAKSRAFGDIVNTVEDTVNKSSAAQLAKDRRRGKRTVRSHDKYANWRERYEARKDRKDAFKEKFQGARRKQYDFDDYDDYQVKPGDYMEHWRRDGYYR